MPAFLIVLYRFFHGLWNGLKDAQFRGLFYWVLGVLGLGTWFYWRVEGWSALDSLYFSVTTLTTVGYGDLYPHSAAGKIFTIFYIIIGIGILSGFVILLAERSGLMKKMDKTGGEKT